MNYKKALEIATKYHKGQKRNKSGLDYITHPIAVSKQFLDDKLRQVAVMHDTIEDTELTLMKLVSFGFEGDVIEAIDLLTKKKNQNYVDYLLNIRGSLTTANLMAMVVKIEDIKHNLSDLENGNMKDKYLLALYILKD